MVSKYQKKGAVEMSLNLIIMLIIGLVVIGLVISFVTGLIGKATQQFDSKLTDVEDADKQALSSKSGPFVISPQSVTLKPGERRKIFVRILNNGGSDIGPSALAISSDTIRSSTPGADGNCESELVNDNAFVVQGDTVSDGQSGIFTVYFEVPSSCISGEQYSVKFEPGSSLSYSSQFLDLQIQD